MAFFLLSSCYADSRAEHDIDIEIDVLDDAKLQKQASQLTEITVSEETTTRCTDSSEHISDPSLLRSSTAASFVEETPITLPEASDASHEMLENLEDLDDDILDGLCNPQAEVREASWKAVGRLRKGSFFQYAEVVLSQLEKLKTLHGLEAVAALGQIPRRDSSELLAACATRALKEDVISPTIECILVTHMRDQDHMSSMKRARSKLIRSGSSTRISASPSGSSLLHLAAKGGFQELAELLLHSGSAPYARDFRGKTAVDIALKHGHKGLAEVLRSRLHFGMTRGGMGDALEDALQDKRRVVKLEWYTIPLEGLFKRVGGKHSLLVATVCEPGNESNVQSYILERSRPAYKADCSKDGIFVSLWSDAAPNVKSTLRCSLNKEDIVSETECPDLTIPFLHKVMTDMGDYEASLVNCHSTAFCVYNTCAAKHAKKWRIPNPVLRNTAKALWSIGIDPNVIQERVSRRGWMTETENLTLHIGKDKDPEDIAQALSCRLGASAVEFRNPYAACAVELCQWVYEAMMPGEEAAVVIENQAGKPFEVSGKASKELLEPGRPVRLEASQSMMELTFSAVGGGIASRFRASSFEVKQGQRYRLVYGEDLKLCLEPHSGLRPGIKCEYVSHQGGTKIASWSVFTCADSIWVSFRGTKSLVDAVVDIGVVPFGGASHGLQVQGVMWLSLTQRNHHTLNAINDVVAKLQKDRPELQKVILCGHSLGGSYAILLGLYRLHLGLAVTSIEAFGAPQCVVPDRDHELWQRLNELTTVYVNAWDTVPRLPACSNWLFDVLPRALPHKLSLKVGAFEIGVKAGGKAIQAFYPHRGIFADYGVVGTLVFMRHNSRKVVVIENTDPGMQQQALEVAPREVAGFVVEDHDSAAYAQILARVG
eukprot:TRINITY_DN25578_c0_g1_i1.p1 TRINITY_DN25578_c0_g1~~TRINITY_DN25578_c0_g1_i1.p1  ORF type:complete len:884 (-),score=129.52 TRINITY_DN25578_c0_g1_i1:277-2928(-)